jgi:hypothetical protein
MKTHISASFLAVTPVDPTAPSKRQSNYYYEPSTGEPTRQFGRKYHGVQASDGTPIMLDNPVRGEPSSLFPTPSPHFLPSPCCIEHSPRPCLFLPLDCALERKKKDRRPQLPSLRCWTFLKSRALAILSDSSRPQTAEGRRSSMI